MKKEIEKMFGKVIDEVTKLGFNKFIEADNKDFQVIVWTTDKDITVTIMNGIDDEGNNCYYAQYDKYGSFVDNDEEYKVYKRLSGAINYAKKMLNKK